MQNITPGVAMPIDGLRTPVSRILGRNPGPMTGPGTNSYLIGKDRLCLIDPGPVDEKQLSNFLEAIKGNKLEYILVTHTHGDHSPAAKMLQAETGAELVGIVAPDALGQDHTFSPSKIWGDGDEINCDEYKANSELRKQYDQAPIEKTNFLKDDTISVAIHLRLGDVANHSGRSSRIDRAVQQISTIRKYLEEKGENFEILVLSQGSPASFTPLVDLGAQLHLNEDLFKTFHTLVCADILCMAKSSLSYAAALLNQKTVIYEPFWHPKLPNWLNDANQLAK